MGIAAFKSNRGLCYAEFIALNRSSRELHKRYALLPYQDTHYIVFKHDLLHNGWRSLYALAPVNSCSLHSLNIMLY